MNGLKIFENEEFGSIRAIEVDGEPWLVGKDVAAALGYQNPSKALIDHVEPEDKLNSKTLLSLGQRGGWLINESGLYSLVFASKLPGAKKFKSWVFNEVLPKMKKQVAECPKGDSFELIKSGQTQAFNYGDIPVRTILISDEPWWVLADVCQVLELSEPHRVATRLEEDEKGRTQITTPGGNQCMTIINESGLYKVVLRSDKPEAKKFTRWVTHEVLPSIRKHGGYIAGQDKMTREEFLARAVLMSDELIKEQEQKILQLESENENQRNEIAELTPKATYCDTVLQCRKPIAITVIAKDYGWSARRMNKELNKRGIQYFCNGTWVLNQKYADKGYTKSVTASFDSGDGTRAKIQTYWTQEGRMFIYNVLKKDGILPMMEAA